MKSLEEIQSEMFDKEETMLKMSEVFGALTSDCRIEILYLLMQVPSLPSGEIGRLTNCSPSQISQYLAKMHSAGIIKRERNWREVVYSLNRKDPFVQGLMLLLSHHLFD